MGDEAGRTEQPEAQGMDGDLGLPAEVALEQDTEVVGESRQHQRRLRGPERLQAKGRQGKALLEFLDHILAVGTAVVVAPDRQRGCARGQTRDQGLEQVAGHLDQLFAASLRPVRLPMPDQDQPPGLRLTLLQEVASTSVSTTVIIPIFFIIL